MRKNAASLKNIFHICFHFGYGTATYVSHCSHLAGETETVMYVLKAGKGCTTSQSYFTLLL